MSHERESRRGGFTLVELMVVIAIIGILISLILVAAADGVRRAEERATQSLITKLETALNDRLDALLNTQAPINQTHRYLASINVPDPNNAGNYIPAANGSSINSYDRRAQVIAQMDYLRAELPDVFFLNSLAGADGATVSGSYPINFAAAPYPPTAKSTTANYVLPLGNTSQGLPFDQGALVPNVNSLYTPPPVSGMFGASFSAAAGIYKNLGYSPAGYDGVDTDGNGLIDDFSESGLTSLPASLSNHTHKTARAEMLYAILVEGLGPLGSAFSRDDFTNKEVQDTDDDGLPEFVDAWGQPLQFYRWPIYHGGASPTGIILGTSDSELGCGQYNSSADARQQDPLDPNQLLMSVAWWSKAANAALTTPSQATFAPPSGTASSTVSQSANGFMNYFHSLVDPFPGAGAGTGWDRSNSLNRRAYFSKFLIVSGGPDREPGTAQLGRDYSEVVSPAPSNAFPGTSVQHSAWSLIYVENQAAVSDPTARGGSFYETPDSSTALTGYLQGTAVLDDITNHNISGPSTGVR